MTYTLARGDWEQPGYTIAGHTTSPPVDWSRVTNVTIHYPGGYSYPLPTLDWFRGYVQQMQRYYVDSRGYSIGYNEIVDQVGHVAQARGEDYRCAANSVNNATSYAIQVAVSNEEPARTAAIEAVRERVAWAQSRAGRKLRITGHREHKPTSCPGAGLWAQVQAGVFDVPYPPTDPTPPGDDDMATAVIWRDPRYIGSYLLGVGVPLLLTPELKAHYRSIGVPEVEDEHDELLAQCEMSTGYTPVPKG